MSLACSLPVRLPWLEASRPPGARRRKRLAAGAAWGWLGAAAPAWAQGDAAAQGHVPSLVWAVPFVLILLAIALLPLVPRLEHWWHRNLNKFLVSLILSLVLGAYYLLRPVGFEGTAPGWPTLQRVLHHALVAEFFPFIVLLFSLFTISGGIRIHGDIPAHPLTNVAILGLGAVLASFIGTTGASMLLIRPLLEINRERKHVTMSVVFFIFIVSNVGGLLLPIGDPPLFMGYLYGVPFMWTLKLFYEWLACVAVLLAIYWVLDHLAYRHEAARDIMRDETSVQQLRFLGMGNLVPLLGVVLAVALLVPGQPLVGTSWVLPDWHLREAAMVAWVGLSLWLTPRGYRKANQFTYYPILEVAALFFGIFITMQAPIEILNDMGPRLGVQTPFAFFWYTGALSSVLDNTPTYVVFFKLAGTLPVAEGVEAVAGLQTVTGQIAVPILEAISTGAVFMGAMTYIGNGPNFMVKSIAEHAGVPMPSFFKFMLYSLLIMGPMMVAISVFLYW
jgi:Na+/H+ antiporter NhaD/arsenite permease-like protein